MTYIREETSFFRNIISEETRGEKSRKKIENQRLSVLKVQQSG